MRRIAPALALASALAACGASPSAPTPDAGERDAAPSTGTTLASCFEGLAPRVAGGVVNVLGFETADGALRLRLAREPGERSAVGETYPYDLVRFAIERDGEVECITEAGSLAYDFGHHNWLDAMTAQGRATYVVSIRYDVGSDPVMWMDTLRVDAGEPMALTLTRCQTMPVEDLNHCLLRGGEHVAESHGARP